MLEIRGLKYTGKHEYKFYPESVIVLSNDNYLLVSRGNNPSVASPRIYETSDGGANWTASANTIERIRDVTCNSIYCLAVGSNGTVYRRDNLINSLLENLKRRALIFPNPTKIFYTSLIKGNYRSENL